MSAVQERNGGYNPLRSSIGGFDKQTAKVWGSTVSSLAANLSIKSLNLMRCDLPLPYLSFADSRCSTSTNESPAFFFRYALLHAAKLLPSS